MLSPKQGNNEDQITDEQYWNPSAEEGPIELTELEGSAEERGDGWPQGFLREQPVNLASLEGDPCSGRGRHMQPTFETSNDDLLTHEDLLMATGSEQDGSGEGRGGTEVWQRQLTPVEEGQSSPTTGMTSQEREQMDNGEQMTFEAFWRANRNIFPEQESAGGPGPADGGEIEEDTPGKRLRGALVLDGGRQHGRPELLKSSRGNEAAPRVHLEMPLLEPASSTFSPTQVLNCDSWAQQLSLQMPNQLDQETFEAGVSPLLRALSPDQLQQLEEKLEQSEQQLAEHQQEALVEKLLIASSSHTKGAEQSGEASPAPQRVGPGGPMPVSQFRVAQATSRQQREEQVATGGQAGNGGLDRGRLEVANGHKPQSHDFRGSKSELVVIQSAAEYQSSMYAAGVKQHLHERERSSQQEASKASSRQCGPRSEKLDGTIVRNLNQIVEPQRSLVSTSQRTEEHHQLEKAGPSGADGSSRDERCTGSVTHILEKDHLQNIREEPLADGKRSLEDFQNLQQIDDAWIRSEESGASQQVWVYNGRLLSRTGAEKDSDPGAAGHTVTLTMSGGAEAHRTSAQKDQATLIFPEHSQSCSSRPMYYHESVIERSHDDDGDEARISPLYAIPSYSALDKSQSRTQTGSLSRSIEHSTKQHRAPAAPRHPQLNPKSLNGSSRHSRADTDAFALLRSSEHSIQKIGGQVVGPRETSEHQHKQQQLLLDHVKSIVFEEVIERTREAKDAKEVPPAEFACSGSKEANAAAGAAVSSINEFLTFAQKLSRSSNGKQSAMESQQRFVPKLMMMELSEGEGAGQRLRDEDVQANGLGQEDGVPVVEQQDEGSESNEEESVGLTGSQTLSARQRVAEMVDTHGLQDLGGVADAKNPKSSSLVNSVYLNNVNGSHSLQSSQKLVDAVSSSQSFAKRAETSPGRAGMLQCWPSEAPAEQTPTVCRSNEVSNSWHTFNQNCGKQKAQQPDTEESKSCSAAAKAQEEQVHHAAEADGQPQHGEAEANPDLSESPRQEHPADQELYEASCSRFFKQSAQSLYSDEETALKNRWEQHQRNQQQRLRRQRNNDLAKKIGCRTTKDRSSAEEARRSQATSKPQSRNTATKPAQAKSSRSNVQGPGLRTADASMEFSGQWSRHGTLRPRNMAGLNCKDVTKSSSSFALHVGAMRDRSRISRLSDAEVEPASQPSDANHSVFNRNKKWQSRVQEKQRKLKQMLERQEISKEREECRFKPKVIGFAYDNTGLTSKQKEFYKCEMRQGADKKDKPVHQRCHEWQESREKKLVRREAQEKVREAKECTFKPKIVQYQPNGRNEMEPQAVMPRRMEKNDARLRHQAPKGFIQRQTDWARSLHHKKSEQKSEVEKEQATEQTFRPKISRASQKIWWRRLASSQLAQEQRRQSAAARYEVSIYVNQLSGAKPSSRREDSAAKLDSRLIARQGTDIPRPAQRPRCKSAGALPRRRATRPPPAFPNNSDLCRRLRPLPMARPNQSVSVISEYRRLRSWSNSNGRSCGPYGTEYDGVACRAESNLELAGSPLLLSHQRPQERDQNEVSASQRPEYEPYVQAAMQEQRLDRDIQRCAQEPEYPVEPLVNQLVAPQNGHRGTHSQLPASSHAFPEPKHHLQVGGDRPIPGRIYKQMKSSESQLPPKPPTPNAPSSHSSKPSYYTEASQQIHEAIAHLQRISERYKAAEKAISHELAVEEAQSAAQTQDQAAHVGRLRADRLPQPSGESEAASSWQAGSLQQNRRTRMQRVTRVRQEPTVREYMNSTSSAAGYASQDGLSWEKENAGPQMGGWVGGGELGQRMERKQAIIRGLRHKQREQGVLIQKGTSIGGAYGQ